MGIVQPMKRMIPAKQLGGVEDPATVLLTPMSLGDSATWWSHDGVLLGGIKINGITAATHEKPHRARLGYLPLPIPRSWGETTFHVVVEYEAEHTGARFKFRIFYGCGDPSELHLGESRIIEGVSGGQQRVKFSLDESKLTRNQLFRATLEIMRESPDPVLIYGVWLEVGV